MWLFLGPKKKGLFHAPLLPHAPQAVPEIMLEHLHTLAAEGNYGNKRQARGRRVWV